VNCLSENSDVKANSPWIFLFTRFSIPTSAVLMWDIITSACPFLHRNLTLDLERWVRPLLTSQYYKKLLLNVRSHCVTQCFPCSVSLPCSALHCVRLRLTICAHTVSRSVSYAASPCLALPCPTSACVSMCVRPYSQNIARLHGTRVDVI